MTQRPIKIKRSTDVHSFNHPPSKIKIKIMISPGDEESTARLLADAAQDAVDLILNGAQRRESSLEAFTWQLPPQ